MLGRPHGLSRHPRRGLLRRKPGVLHEASALAAQSADPDDDVRGSAAYKRRSIGVLLPRTIHEAKVAADG